MLKLKWSKKDLEFIGTEDIITAEKKTKKKPFRFRKRYLAIVAVVLILVTAAVQAAVPKNESHTVEAAFAETGDVQVRLDTSGTVESGEEKTYFAPAGARVAAVPFEAGDVVSAGDKLVEFDQSDLDRQYKTAELTNAASEYGFRDAVSKSGQSAGDLSSARSTKGSLEKKIKNKKSEIASLQEQVRIDAASASRAQNSQLSDIQKEKNALNDELLELSKKAIDLSSDVTGKTEQISTAVIEGKETKTLQNELSDLNAEYNNNQKRQLEINTRLTELSVDESGLAVIDTGDSETKLANAQSDLAELQSELAMAESEISMAEAGIMTENALGQLEATSNIEELTAMTTMELLEKAREGIVAEFGGVVTRVAAIAGDTSMQAGELITVASNEQVKVRISVTKYDLEKIEVGQNAQVTVAGKEYTAKVTKIDRMAMTNEEGVITIGAELTLSNPDKDIFLGIEASVSIEGEKSSGVVLVPSVAVNMDTEGQFCYVVEAGIVKRQPVVTGTSSDKYMEIREGIRAGDQVITSVNDDITEGTQVTVAQAEDN